MCELYRSSGQTTLPVGNISKAYHRYQKKQGPERSNIKNPPRPLALQDANRAYFGEVAPVM
jgi:hypothetical protein